MNLQRLEEMRTDCIEAVEKTCRGSADSVLPALIFQDLEDLNEIQQARLSMYLEMFNIGRMTAGE